MNFSIETPRLVLRPFTMKDTEDFFNITRDDDIHIYIPGCYFDSLEVTQKVFEYIYTKSDFKRDFYLAIEEKNHKTLIGSFIITQNYKLNYYDSCYFIKKEERRKGYLYEALTAFLEQFPIHNSNFIFQIEKNNDPSLAAIQKIKGITELSNDRCAFTIFHYHVD